MLINDMFADMWGWHYMRSFRRFHSSEHGEGLGSIKVGIAAKTG
jgi:hypothetical protein